MDDLEPEIPTLINFDRTSPEGVARKLRELSMEVGRYRLRKKAAEAEAHRLLEENRVLVARAEGAETAFREIVARIQDLQVQDPPR